MPKYADVQAYIDAQAPEMGEVVRALVDLVRKNSPKGTEEAIKWSQPVFSQGGPAIFMKAAKSHVTFGFWRGTELDDPKGLLEGDGDRMRHVKVRAVKDIPKGALGAMIRQAYQLNRDHGDPTTKAAKEAVQAKAPAKKAPAKKAPKKA